MIIEMRLIVFVVPKQFTKFTKAGSYGSTYDVDGLVCLFLKAGKFHLMF